MKTFVSPRLWLAAEYHLPSTYSCRLPMSSASSAPVSPAPGPATVRLALLRTSIELFGVEETRQVLFPTVCSMAVRIRPPAQVAISPHILRAYKMEEETWGTQIIEAPISREMAHADGPLTIDLHVPASEVRMWRTILQAIGYWGQASSLVWCTHLEEQLPVLQECLLPLHEWAYPGPLRPFFSCILSEFRTLLWVGKIFFHLWRRCWQRMSYVWMSISGRWFSKSNTGRENGYFVRRFLT